jgi:hypothetical protein
VKLQRTHLYVKLEYTFSFCFVPLLCQGRNAIKAKISELYGGSHKGCHLRMNSIKDVNGHVKWVPNHHFILQPRVVDGGGGAHVKSYFVVIDCGRNKVYIG